VFERELECAAIDCLGADLGEVGDFTGVELFRADEVEQLVGIFRAEGGRENAFEGADEVLGGEGFAIGPLCIGAQVERVNKAVIGDGPVFGDPGSRVASR
jgi:hypothetical protein